MSAHILIVEARFYEDIAEELAAGAVAVIESRGATYERIAVPGSLEVPQAISIALGRGGFDGVVALGCVIRGQTAHFDIVATESARALMQLALAHEIPLGNGILTVDTREQALARARISGRDRGGHAARACLDVLDIKRRHGGRGHG